MFRRLLIALLLVSGLASAATITLANSMYSNLWEDIWMREHGTTNVQQLAGVISLTLNNNGTQTTLYALCVQLFVTISEGGTYNTTIYTPANTPGEPTAQLERVAWLVENALLPVVYSSITSTQIPQADWANTAAAAAGLQLAIWDIMEDNADGLGAGNVQRSTGTATPADVQNWVTTYENLSAGQASTLGYVLVSTNQRTGVGVQTLIAVQVPPPGIPEPSTSALGGIGLVAGIGLAVWRTRHPQAGAARRIH
jgi:hypothetical protein